MVAAAAGGWPESWSGVGVDWPGGSPENTGLIIAIIVGAYFVALWISAAVWTARDIRHRTDDPVAQIVSTLIVLAFNFPGLVLYRVLRPPLTLQEAEEHRLETDALSRELHLAVDCPRCQAEILPDYIACPRCAAMLRSQCEACGRVLDPAWVMCPWCARRVATEPSAAPTEPRAETPIEPAPPEAIPHG